MSLRVEQLGFGYAAGKAVLAGLSGEFPAGAITAVIGPNGAGKSTLLRLLLGVLKPTAGRATLDAHETGGLSGAARARGMGYLPQRSGVWAPFTVRQVVGMGRFARPRDEGAVERALGRVGLMERGGELFGRLSAGQQQRAGLARVLAQLDGPETGGTRCLLADEPTAALDPRHAAEAMKIMREEAARGVAVVVVLHDFSAAARWADRVLLMNETGGCAAWGATSETLNPEGLERVFGVRFARVETEGGPAMVTLGEGHGERAGA
jgi:iron complex transport system ATP-binding protein